MATLIEYSDRSEFKDWFSGAKITPIGYLTANPQQAFSQLLPNLYVVDYSGIAIPSRSKFANHNQGLRLSPVPDGIGLVGTIKMLNKSDLFQSCRHEPFSDRQRKEIVHLMKSRLAPLNVHQEPLSHPDAEKYALIFDALGHPTSVDELVSLSTHAEYHSLRI